jgi:hypothetical protein
LKHATVTDLSTISALGLGKARPAASESGVERFTDLTMARIFGAAEWWSKNPKNALFNACSWYGFPKPEFKHIASDKSTSLCSLAFPSAICKKIEAEPELARRHRLTAAVQEVGGGAIGGGALKDAENACAREACRQLSTLGLLHPKKPTAWPAWLPRTNGGNVAAAHRRSATKPASLELDNLSDFQARAKLGEDEVAWLLLQWYGSAPKQWFFNTFQIHHWPTPRFRFQRPWAVESLRAHLHRHVLNHSYDRIYL